MDWYIDLYQRTNWFKDPLANAHQSTSYYRHEFARDYTIRNDTIYFRNVVVLNIEYYYKILDVIKKIVFNGGIIQCSYGSFLPKSNITRITFDEKFNQLFELTPYLTYVRFGMFFNQKLVLTSAMQRVYIGSRFTQSIVLGKNISVMDMVSCSNVPFKLNKKMEYFAHGKGDFSWIFCSGLSKNLKYFVSNAIYGQYTILPKRLVYLDFKCGTGTGKFILPLYIKYLVVHSNYKHYDTTELLSDNLHLCINVSLNPNVMDELPNGLKSVIISCPYWIKCYNMPNDKMLK